MEPMPDTPRLVEGDPVRLRQILINLIGNAIKFTKDGRVTVRIERAGPPERPDGPVPLRFMVDDTGIGVPDDARDRLFDAFVQADSSTTRQYGGTGLGLSITQRLTRLMGGDIDFESITGVGSTFWVTVPLIVAHGSAAALTAQDLGMPDRRRKPDAAAAGQPSRRVLLVEDNDVNRLLFQTLLEREGYEVVMAATGFEALDRLAEEAVQLVLLDIQMPELDGIETAKRIRALDGPAAGLPIVALTANAMSGDRERYIAAGMDDYIAKPIEPARFLETVARHAAAEGRGKRVLQSLIATLQS